jgi:hypothetical protein
MKNILLGIVLIALLAVGILKEPVRDTVDFITGASTDTYATQIDLIAGVSDGGGSHDSLGS